MEHISSAIFNDIQNYWNNSKDSREQVAKKLDSLSDEDLSMLFKFDETRKKLNHIVESSHGELLNELLLKMSSPFSPEHNGFYLLDIVRALENERAIESAIKREVNVANFKQMAAFKTNHSLILQYARLASRPDAGLEVASLPEVVESCSIGFKPENIVFANTTINEREFVISCKLGVYTYCFDRPNKLSTMIEWCKKHDIDRKNMRFILRLATPYAGASVSMGRFGVYITKNPKALKQILHLLHENAIQLAGVSFHIGIGASNFFVYDNVFSFIAQIFRATQELGNYIPDIVNIGGGFEMTDAGYRFRGNLSIDEQISRIGKEMSKLEEEFDKKFEVWSEVGQAYVGTAGSVVVRVDYSEIRENPNRVVSVSPELEPGTTLWGHPSKEVFAVREQHLITQAGDWTFGIVRHLTMYPEIWHISDDGAEKIDFSSKEMIPTLIFGKTCDSTDILNPKRDSRPIRILLPKLDTDKKGFFVLRLCSAAYMDTGGEFNWQSSTNLPVYHCLAESDKQNQGYPISVLNRPADEKSEDIEWEYHDRVLRRNALTSDQIHQAKCLIAEQFVNREQMISWLKSTGKITPESDDSTLTYLFWEKVEECMESGLSMVRLKVPKGKQETEGTVVGAITVKVINAEDIPKLPLNLVLDWERRVARVIFEAEVIVLDACRRINGNLKEKIFPMAYTAMAANTKGENILTLLAKVHELVKGAPDLKSFACLATGEGSAYMAKSVPGIVKMLHVPYDSVNYCGERIFSGIKFRSGPAELGFYIIDMRGPYKLEEPLPTNREVDVNVWDDSYLPSDDTWKASS
ncbi:MAG: hypothetical protein HWE27_14235 [Gammaproteobacteria bacterium]|nr:hypothetical protein [Gammaproteobacteria bacterium]